MIKLHDKYFEPFISADEIDAAIKKMAKAVKADFKNETPIFVCVLNGAFMFASDFIKHYDQPCEVSFVKLSSYHGISSTGIVKTLLDVSEDIEGRSVVILEDVIDTGSTVKELVSMFSNINVKRFKIASMFYKPEVYSGEYNIDYVGIEIPDRFIVGYGLDYNELGRNLPEVYQIKEE
ncbi:hypoxanthine phosphoribosyltransferase [Galbibacter sp. EGI 63066]|uniref:hypoxanthine phosphoribosyltransferase n=1 Tax=Galbibacter sp. EGI 63066 TaxID=2993559 RepID=UPI002B057824|nr:hypoxanthine phosphoribosyltransferase [Galbibacter sp. EGI 63066]